MIISLTIAAVTAVVATLLYAVFDHQTSETPTPVHDLRDYRPGANTRAVSGELLIPENQSAMEYLAPNRRSMNGRPLESTGILMPLTDGGIHGISASRNRYPNNHRYDGGVTSPEKYDETGVRFDAETQQNTNRCVYYVISIRPFDKSVRRRHLPLYVFVQKP